MQIIYQRIWVVCWASYSDLHLMCQGLSEVNVHFVINVCVYFAEVEYMHIAMATNEMNINEKVV